VNNECRQRWSHNLDQLESEPVSMLVSVYGMNHITSLRMDQRKKEKLCSFLQDLNPGACTSFKELWLVVVSVGLLGGGLWMDL
jgi:hypothetical protein